MAAPINSLKKNILRTRVSSVLNKDVKQFGKQYLFDDDDETCWNSDQGTPQWVIIDFNQAVSVQEIHVQFQGGFVGKSCLLETPGENNDYVQVFSFQPQDSNQTQIFHLTESVKLSSLRITFDQSTDFFGRITIYKLDILGQAS
ncbi:nuclear receptor 2C2-associated protein-like [Physella acuta]|uniref:nuclear receptor 2C2-associated protein-like n=1 Tax=Physella acuta TaxID=109671 RepID=UPI0027DB1FDD|nr:nuclear receptor 2C2-associated protein-like [Physella acuta]